MIILGLTGSIGMGKSTTAQMFRDEKIPVHDADASVHELYSGAAAPLIEAVFPGTNINGTIDRKILGTYVIGKPEEMKKLENIVHPLVAAARDNFINQNHALGTKIVVMDIPLLFETGGEKYCDFVAVVTTTREEQKNRVLARLDMDEEKFEKILASQMPDADKREKADFLIDTSNGIDSARSQVQTILSKLMKSDVINA